MVSGLPRCSSRLSNRNFVRHTAGYAKRIASNLATRSASLLMVGLLQIKNEICKVAQKDRSVNLADDDRWWRCLWLTRHDDRRCRWHLAFPAVEVSSSSGNGEADAIKTETPTYKPRALKLQTGRQVFDVAEEQNRGGSPGRIRTSDQPVNRKRDRSCIGSHTGSSPCKNPHHCLIFLRKPSYFIALGLQRIALYCMCFVAQV